jgi:thioesterase domain-containing protein
MIRQPHGADPWSSLVALQPYGSKTPLFCVHPGGGNVLTYRDLALRLGDDQPVYALQAQGLNGVEAPSQRIEDMAAHYLHAIRTVQTDGPYLLAGLSTGGEIAWEMAQQLHAMDQEVGLLILFDTYGPGYPQLLPPWQRSLSVLMWCVRDSVSRVIHFPAKCATLVKHLGWRGIGYAVCEKLGLERRVSEPGQPTAKYETLQHKLDRYWQNARHIRTWEKRLNLLIVSILNRSSVPDVARRFANAMNDSLRGLYASEDIPQELQDVERVVNAASQYYRPSAYAGRVAYFEAERPPGIVTDLKSGWGDLILGELHVYKSPGVHAEVIYSPVLAHQLKTCLEQAQAELRR